MLLALQDSGQNLKPVAKKLKWIARRHKGDLWKDMVAQVEDVCLCAYRVALLVEKLFGPEIGPRITTSIIRGRFPQEPEAFERSGSLTGRPKVQNYLGSVTQPNRVGLGQIPHFD
jgi:hypothetical protein